jgi:hypothetical protein
MIRFSASSWRRGRPWLVVAPLALVAAACTLPSVFANVEGSAHRRTSSRWGACWEAEGGRPEFVRLPAAPTGFVQVGHEKFFIPGADPFPCHHTTDHRYAGLLKFDIPPSAPRILRAVLRPVESSSVGGRFGSRPAAECVVTVARAAEIWETEASPRFPRTTPLFPGSFATDTIRLGTIAPDGALHPGLDVTSVAQDWQEGRAPNLGFVITSNAAFTREQRSSCVHNVVFAAEVEFEDP